MEYWCNDADRWNVMYSEEPCPSASFFVTNHNGLGVKEILRSAINRLSQGMTQDFTKVNINYVSMM